MGTITAQSYTDPQAVVLELFKSAQDGNFDRLSNLCDPQGECDGDVTQICDLKNKNSEFQNQFTEQFKKGRIAGKAEIRENYAKIKIKFGKNGKKDETIVLVKRENFWYLISM